MIIWINKYSDTMEDDKHGRWARIGYVGEGLDSMEVAWIRKVEFKEYKFKFIVQVLFPRKGEIMFKTLEEAKEQVRIDLEHFKTLLRKE